MITYKDLPHTYESSTNNYTSATTLLKSFEPDKDWVAIATKYAKKYNTAQKKLTGINPKTDAEYWRVEWDKKADKACVRGTAYHLEQELNIINKKVLTVGSSQIPVIPSLLDSNEEKKSLDTLVLDDGVYPELIVWNNELLIAGQADQVIIHKGFIHLIDYKTSEKIDHSAYVRYDGSYDTFKDPIDDIEYCKANQYYLQLNMYAYMIKLHNPGLKIGRMVMRHIRFDENDKVLDHQDWDAPLMQKEIKKIFKYVKGN